MFRKVSLLFLSLTLLAPALIFPLGAHAEDEEVIPDPVPRVAVAYDIGFLGDDSFNDAVHRGLEIAKKKYKLVEPFVREVPTNGTNLDQIGRAHV